MTEQKETPQMQACRLCPRECGADRTAGQRGRCRMTARLTAARAALHMWEEPCLSGEEGSGAVFFSGCALGCVYCQNREIASGRVGKEISVNRLAEIFLTLQRQRANNINLVTAGHFAVPVARALELAKTQGLRIPVVYNSSGYEKEETLRMLDGLVDIYLPDLKYWSPDLAGRYSAAWDYFDVAAKAIEEMVRQIFGKGTPPRDGKTGLEAGRRAVFDDRGQMQRGVIVRHLQLPGCLEDSKHVIRYLYETYGDQIYISIMNQYTPPADISRFPELNRRLTKREYDKLVNYAIGLGVENGFIQEGRTASESFIPAFDLEGI